MLANLFWLLDWANYWWIHTPLNLEAPALTAHTLRALWEAPVWGEPADRTLACFVARWRWSGVVLMHRGGCRPAARLFGLGMVGWLLLAGTAVVWGPLARAGGDRLFVPALLFAAAPAAHALTTTLRPVPPLGRLGGAALAGGGCWPSSPWPCRRTATPGSADGATVSRCKSASAPTATTWWPC